MSTGNDAWPVPAFHFRVKLGRRQVAFAEVTGIEAVIGAPEGRVTMRRGIFKGDLTLWRWFEQCAAKPERRSTVTIELLDADGEPVRRWTLREARPVRIAGPDLCSTANAVAMETLEVAFATIQVSAP